MTGKQALDELKRLEKQGKLDEVLNIDIISVDDVREWMKPITEEDVTGEAENKVDDWISNHTKMVGEIVDDALDIYGGTADVMADVQNKVSAFALND